MSGETSRICSECQGAMSPIEIMDKVSPDNVSRSSRELEYRQPDDKRSFLTGKFPSTGKVLACLCEGCGRIALYAWEPLDRGE